jgi:transcriptional regulator with PAS, ATPase and Fis domain
VVPIHIPPLRERKEDIPFLTRHFLNKFNISFNKKIPGLSEKAMEALNRYHWPGNIRELENLIERIVVLAPGDLSIDVKDIPFEILMDSGQNIQDLIPKQAGLIKIREAVERRIILNVLEATQWNQTESAKILKVNRNTLIQKAKQLGIPLRRAD